MLTFVALALGALGCRDGDSQPTPRVDQGQPYSSAGEVSLRDGSNLSYEITSESYKQWYEAHQGLDRRIASRYGALLQPSSPTERSIDRAVRYLQTEPNAREAIAKSGMSVRAFVEMTVALEQQMRVASTSQSPAIDTMPLPPAYGYPLDTLYRQPYPPPYPTPYPPGYPNPQPYPTPYPPGYQPPGYPAVPLPSPAIPARRVDSVPRADSMFLPRVDSARRDTLLPRREVILPRRDTALSLPVRDSLLPRRDTLVPKRDTAIRRDTLGLPRPSRDTVRRDTLPPRPPDSIR